MDNRESDNLKIEDDSFTEEDQRAFFEHMNEAVIIGDVILDESGEPVDWMIRYVNPAHEVALGIPVKDSIGHLASVAYGPVRLAYYLSWLGKVATTRHPIRFEAKSPITDRYFVVSAFSPKPRQFAAIITDVTERKRAADAVRATTKNLKLLFDFMPAACFAYDRDGILTQANPECERIYGFTREQLIGRSMFDTIATPESETATREIIERVFSGETVENLEFEDKRADGTYIHVLTNTTPAFNEKGEVVMGLSLNIDITGRKIAELDRAALEEHKREFYRKTIFAATGGKLVMTEADDIERLAGPAMATMTISEPWELRNVRHMVVKAGETVGLDDDRLHDLELCAGEAATNALKHAGQGTVSIHRLAGERLLLVVSDNGPGIETLVLPEATLRLGYSTTNSLGMGYKAIISMADKVYLTTGEGGTTVAVEMEISVREPASALDALPDTW